MPIVLNQKIPDSERKQPDWLSLFVTNSKTFLIVRVDLSCLKEKSLLLIQNILAYELVRRAFFYTFHFCQKRLSCAYQLSTLWSELVMPKIYQTEAKRIINIFKLYWRTSLYAVHFCTKKWRTSSYAHTFFLHFKFFKTDFSGLKAS